MTDPTVRLTDEDRAELAHIQSLGGYPRVRDQVFAAVERILARHVAEAEARGGREALAEAADEIKAEIDLSDAELGTEWRTDEYRNGFDVALICVRARARAADPAPEVDLPTRDVAATCTKCPPGQHGDMNHGRLVPAPEGSGS